MGMGIRLLLLWIGVWIAHGSALANTGSVEPVAHPGMWRWVAGEAESPDAPPEAAAWTPLDLAATANAAVPWTLDAVVWLRTEVDVPEHWRGEPLAVEVLTQGKTRAYVGELALETIEGSPRFEVPSGQVFFAVPAQVGSSFELTLRNELPAATAPYIPGRMRHEVWVGPANVLPVVRRTAHRAQELQSSVPILISIGVYALIVLFFSALFWRRWNYTYLWFALTMGFSGAWSALVVYDAVAVPPASWSLGMQLGTAHLCIGFGMRFYWALLREDRAPWWWMLFEYGCLFAGVANLVWVDVAVRIVGTPINEILALGALGLDAGLLILEAWRGRRAARIILTGVTPSSLVLVVVLLSQLGWFPGVPAWVVSTATLGIIAAMGYALIDEFELDRSGPPVVTLPSKTTAQLMAISTMGPESVDTLAPTLGEGEHLPSETQIGRYVLRECLGRGGMGEVYRAHDPNLARDVAIKLVAGANPGDAARQALLHREALAMARCVHPRVVTIYDVGTFEDQVFLAMEYLRGVTLGDWQREASAAEVIERYVQAGEGLHAAHRAQVVHGDFKPENVMCTEDGRTVVVDFGIARTGDDDSVHLSGAGTPAYMAPELHEGAESTAHSDQYAFGIATLQALLGEHPWALADDVQGLRAELGHQATAVPDDAVEPLLRAIARDPSQRFSDMGQLVEALKTA